MAQRLQRSGHLRPNLKFLARSGQRLSTARFCFFRPDARFPVHRVPLPQAQSVVDRHQEGVAQQVLSQ